MKERIQQTRTDDSDWNATSRFFTSGKSRAKLAESEAQDGWPKKTASHLYQDNELTIIQKAEILAEAFIKAAERSEGGADEWLSLIFKEPYLRKAKQSRRIAQGLRRADKKA